MGWYFIKIVVMQIYTDKGKLIKRPKLEEQDLKFSDSFLTLFDKNEEPVTFTEQLEAGCELNSLSYVEV